MPQSSEIWQSIAREMEIESLFPHKRLYENLKGNLIFSPIQKLFVMLLHSLQSLDCRASGRQVCLLVLRSGLT